MDDRDRQAIIRRRLGFVTSTLTAVGCTGPTQPVAGPPEATVAAPHPVPSAQDAGAETAAAVPPTRNQPTADPDAPPSLDPPTSSCESHNATYARKRANLQRAYAAVARAQSTQPGCSIHEASCAPAWQRFAKDVGEADNALQDMYSLCHCTTDDPPGLDAYVRPHATYLAKRIAQLEAHAGDTEAARKKLIEMRSNAVPMRPCLSCVPCAVNLQLKVGGFQANSTVTGQLTNYQYMWKIIAGEPKIITIVTGFRSKAEAPDISKKRAILVKNELIKAGTKAASIRVIDGAIDTAQSNPAGTQRVDVHTVLPPDYCPAS